MAYELIRPATAFSVTRTKQRKPRQKDDTHLRWVRSLPSLVPGSGHVEAAHIRYADPRYFKRETGMGEKPDDRWVVPLCAEEHRRQHAMNEQDYWIAAGIDPVFVAAMLWNNTGNDEAAEQILAQAQSTLRGPVRSDFGSVVFTEEQSDTEQRGSE